MWAAEHRRDRLAPPPPMPALTDTIAAVSSPPGRSPRGLLRIAGPRALDIAESLSTPTDRLRLSTQPRTLLPARLRTPPLPILAAFFPAPRSYTGDDLIELQLPGHPALLERVLQQTLHSGARLAEPGEFTFRAFAAGKLDLTQAEGVAATIAATSDSQLRAASLLREGKLGSFATELVDAVGGALALVEAGIDFTDQDDVVPITPRDLDARLADAESKLASLLARSRSWGSLDALPRVVLVGPPSAGKSTLFNALLGRERAVISPTPGTTRDALAEPLTLTTDTGRSIELMLVDIAGLDHAEALLDREAQAAAQRAIDAADLILQVIDPTSSTTPRPTAPPGVPTLSITTKSDLVAQRRSPRPPGVGPEEPTPIPVSALTGAGLNALRAALARALGDRGASLSADMLALQPRHEAALGAALAHLRQARALLAPQRDAHAIASVELVAGALRAALDELAGLGGQLTPDDVIGRVFATFCVGK